MPPVYIRGVGCVSALAPTWPATRERLARGEHGVRSIARFDATGAPCMVAAEIEDACDGDRRVMLSRAAVAEAWKASALEDAVDPERVGVFVGAEPGRIPFSTLVSWARAGSGRDAPFDRERFSREAIPLAQMIDRSQIAPDSVTRAIAADIDARGPTATVSLACASGSASIAQAVRAIRLGHCDAAIAGGVGADVDPMTLADFGHLGVLSERGVSRPFDVHRDGFVLGEGAAFVVLARERGHARAAVIGAASSLDGGRLTAPDPSADGAVRAIASALCDAKRSSVDYVQAHGTSTVLNDETEALALHRVFGARIDEIWVSSVKGALGHWIAGAGALGFLCAHEAIASGIVLPTANLVSPDPKCKLRHAMGSAVEARIETALVNSFAFGGVNVCLALGRIG